MASMIEIERYRSSPIEVQAAMDLVDAYHEAKLADIAYERSKSFKRWQTDYFLREAEMAWDEVDSAYERWILLR